MKCEVFDTPQAALARVLEENPAVLAVGETHAQIGSVTKTKTTTSRFTNDLLPTLRGKTSDLVLELWVANGACAKRDAAAVKKVASAQHEVTRTQSPKDMTDFIALYNAARANDMKPHILVPACDEYAAIADAGAGDVDAMLAMIARLSASEMNGVLETAPFVVAYGGAMHNDLEPRHPRWSFGPEMAAKTKDRYVELDLVSPELIGDSDSWQAQPWYPHFHPKAQGKKQTVLFTMRAHSYALIFPPD